MLVWSWWGGVGDDGSEYVGDMHWSLCHSQESAVSQKGPLPTDFSFCSYSHHVLVQKCVKTTYNAEKATLFTGGLAQPPSLSQWDLCEHSGPSLAAGIWGLPGALVRAGADWRMWMDVVCSKILADRQEPEFLCGLGWLVQSRTD